MKKFFIHGIVLVILASSLVVLFCQLVETTPQALAYTTTTYEKIPRQKVSWHQQSTGQKINLKKQPSKLLAKKEGI